MKKNLLILFTILILIPYNIKASEICGATLTTKEGIITPYSDLKKALREAKEGDLINLSDNYEYSGKLEVKEGVTLILLNNATISLDTIIVNGTVSIIEGSISAETFLGSGTIDVNKDNKKSILIESSITSTLKLNITNPNITSKNIVAYLGKNEEKASKILKDIELDAALANYKLILSKININKDETEYFATLDKRNPTSIKIAGKSNKYYGIIKDSDGKELIHQNLLWSVDEKAISNNVTINNGIISNPNHYMDEITITLTLKEDINLTTQIIYNPTYTENVYNTEKGISVENLSDKKWLDNTYLGVEEITYNKNQIKEINKKYKNSVIIKVYKLTLYNGTTIINPINTKISITLDENTDIDILSKNKNYSKVSTIIKENKIIFNDYNLGEFILIDEIKNTSFLSLILIVLFSIIILVSIILGIKKYIIKR